MAEAEPRRQGLLMLAYLCKGETFADLAAGFGVGTMTAWRYLQETAALLAARAPQLRKAVRDAKTAGYAYVVDGTLIPIDRPAADRPFYSGKHKRHGMNLQVIASPDGDILWVSGPLPGSVHDKKAAHARSSRTAERTSQDPRKRQTVRTRNSARPMSGRTPSSRPGESSASSAAAVGAGQLAKAIHTLEIHAA
jgi:DDE superfamily endonuclease/Helix-turn-helix of DDE superfamily endonuclease